MGALQLVVPVAHEEERRDGLEPSRQQTNDVQRRLVRPVHVLQHKHGRLAGELGDEGLVDVVWLRGGEHELRERAPDHPGDIEERSQWPRREERVAGPPEDAGAPHVVCEAAEKRGLADSGLAGDEQHAPAPGDDIGECLRERVERDAALEELFGVRLGACACCHELNHRRSSRVVQTRGCAGAPKTKVPAPRALDQKGGLPVSNRWQAR